MKNKNPLVSVIMNCYNGDKYIREAIDSIISQTYNNFEIIFWDNASVDNSADIAKSYGDKIRYFYSNKNIGLGAARNRAIAESKGDLIAFLDCDDIWLPSKLEEQVSIMSSDDTIVVSYSDGYYLYDNNKSYDKFSYGRNTIFYQGDIFNKLVCSNFINWQT